ncbi:MAG: glutamine synthetase family protein [Cellulosilyticaceae bacterium]
MEKQVRQWIEEQDIKFIRLEFIDLLGQIKNIAIPVSQAKRVFAEGILVDGSAVEGLGQAEPSDILLMPIVQTLLPMPWRPQQGKVARVICEMRQSDGSSFEGDSREVLRRVVEDAKRQGFTWEVGVACEFFLFHTDDTGTPTTKTHDQGGYFDLAPLDYGENTRREICMVLEELGLEVAASHHEAAAGQHEIDFKAVEGLMAADNILTFKKAVKIIAQRNGLHATFMPKPLTGASGSGMHLAMMLYRDGKNIFWDCLGGLSEEGEAFAWGILNHIQGISAITNPLVNSYKRLLEINSNAIRIPAVHKGEFKIELRNPDATCNPYLALALVLAAGLEGIRLLGEEKQKTKDLQGSKLPASLEEAIQAMKSDDFIKKVVGEHIYHKYIMAKESEVYAYNRQVHEWEIQAYLYKY